MPSAAAERALAVAGMWVATAAPVAGADELRDAYFGEAIYRAHQEDWFGALERLDTELAQYRRIDEPHLDTLHFHIEHAEFSVGDFELHYRMHHRAGRAIEAVLEGDVEEPVRNEAAFRLGRIHFQKGQPGDALEALDGMSDEVADSIRDEALLLRANAYLAVGKPSQAAEVLRGLGGSDELSAFAAYNLGIALLEDGEARDAAAQLDRAGRISASDPADLAIRDKANLVLGTLLFEAAEYELAQRSLDRVRLRGPFSNQALLRAGWADASAQNYERALVPWSELAGREATDAAVQEALLALPYAYSKLEVHGRAAVLYGRAVESFGDELAKVDASIESIRQGRFLEALVREEIRHDKDWVVHLRSLPDAPETFYLLSLMASHPFQTALQNYLDLEDLRKRLASWRASFDAFDELVDLRRAYYEPILPDVDGRFRELDAQMRLRMEQSRSIEKRLEHMLIAPRPDLLATATEQRLLAQIDELEAALETLDAADAEPLQRRIRRLRGALTWNLETQYHRRLTEVHDHLRELQADLETLQERYDAFVRTRQAATHSYVGYEAPIARLRGRVEEAQERVGVLMARQGRMLEAVAIEELALRRARLEAYQNQARFAFADSYDRASKEQAP